MLEKRGSISLLGGLRSWDVFPKKHKAKLGGTRRCRWLPSWGPELGVSPPTSAFGDPSRLLAWLHHFGGGYGTLCSPSLARRTRGEH